MEFDRWFIEERGLGYPLQDQLMDAAVGKIAGNFRAGVISTEGLLVDVFFEDVTQHIGVDLVTFSARCVIQIP